jgi:hypothetical protein
MRHFYAEVKAEGKVWETCQYQTKDASLAKAIIQEQWTMETNFLTAPPQRDIKIVWL